MIGVRNKHSTAYKDSPYTMAVIIMWESCTTCRAMVAVRMFVKVTIPCRRVSPWLLSSVPTVAP